MKTVIFLLSVSMVLVDSATLSPDKVMRLNLENIIYLTDNRIKNLDEGILKTLLKDLTHLTETTIKCKDFFCEAQAILESVENALFEERGELVRLLKQYNNHRKCSAVNQSQDNQVELKKFLHDLNACGKKINFNQIGSHHA
ncbi:hypothetical protein DPEC_G00226930 [Dallia pectoralis]|uniref:Uncharacterized protein n=1 Tax=Dallia pectoralis TaxID=75939 RepID=A0ACC2G0U1_DALPE|nr:hypothetical protein DPEC_G00226930 [Dallia pectoralis]